VVCIKRDRQIREGEVGLYICIVHRVQAVTVRHTYDAVVKKTSEHICARAMRRLRGEDNIKLNPRELLCEGVDWNRMAVDGMKWWSFC
jgi:hypothetical protein